MNTGLDLNIRLAQARGKKYIEMYSLSDAEKEYLTERNMPFWFDEEAKMWTIKIT